MKTRKKKSLERKRTAVEVQKNVDMVKETAEEKKPAENTGKDEFEESEYQRRLARHYDELKWLYCELYQGQQWAFDDLCQNLKKIYKYRKEDLKELDRIREADPEWYKKNDVIGMMMYVDAFAEN